MSTLSAEQIEYVRSMKRELQRREDIIGACEDSLIDFMRELWPILEPSEPFDKTYAHKPWVLKYNGVVYHFYCAVGDQGRVIALATSRDLRATNNPAIASKTTSR